MKSKDRLPYVEEVAGQIDIVDVCLLTSNCQRPVNPGNLTKRASAGHRAEVQYDKSARSIRVIVQFRFEAFESVTDASDKTGLLIEASYGLSYVLKTDKNITLEKARAFGEVNGIYNAWPFWREFVYTTLARMGLPPITLPVFRIADDV